MYRYAYTYSVTKELWKWWKHLSRLLSSCSPCNTVCMVYAYITSAHTSSYNANQAANPTCPHIFWIAVYHWQSNSQTIDTQIARISFIRNQFTRRLVLTSSIRTDKWEGDFSNATIKAYRGVFILCFRSKLCFLSTVCTWALTRKLFSWSLWIIIPFHHHSSTFNLHLMHLIDGWTFTC